MRSDLIITMTGIRQKNRKIVYKSVGACKKLDIPVIVHSRDASNDTMEILREYKPKGVVHCFSGSAETAKEIIAWECISFTGVLTFKMQKALRAFGKKYRRLQTLCLKPTVLIWLLSHTEANAATVV